MFVAKFLCICILLEWCSARYIVPKFYGKDSAVIVDADKQLPKALRPKLQNALYYNYPVYQLIKQNTATRNSSTSSTTTTTTTTEPALVAAINDDKEFPGDLLFIAQHKLGLKHLDEIPSISELGELLGTVNATETIKYIRQLTATQEGIALMKAYIESTDYTDNGNVAVADDIDDNDYDDALDAVAKVTDKIDETNDYADDSDEIAAADGIDDEDEQYAERLKTRISSTTSTKMVAPKRAPTSGFLQSLGNYMNIYNLWSAEYEHSSSSSTSTTTAAPATTPARGNQLQAYGPIFLPAPPTGTTLINMPRPLLVRQPLPYHYPIPIRPILVTPASTTVKTTMADNSTMPTKAAVVHLNTPKKHKLVTPYMQQIAQMANIPSKKLDLFLQRKPKLAELALRVSSLPLNQQQANGNAIDAQLLAAVQRAVEQDEDLKKLLNSAETLK